MKRLSLNTIKAIVRVFIRGANSNDQTPATANKIHYDVCRQLRIKRDSKRRNYYRTVVEALQLLRKQRVLLEDINEPPGGQRERWPAGNMKPAYGFPVDNRTTWRLTPAVEDYLTSPRSLCPAFGVSDNAVLNDSYVCALLEHFGVLSPQQTTPMTAGTTAQAHVSATPSLAVAAVDVDAKMRERLVNTVMTTSRYWQTYITPADMLGAMYALYVEDCRQPAKADRLLWASMSRLGWPSTQAHNYGKCSAVLVQAGLIAPFKTVRSQFVQPNGRPQRRPYGFIMTPRGIEVAIAGNFEDSRPRMSLNRTRKDGRGVALRNFEHPQNASARKANLIRFAEWFVPAAESAGSLQKELAFVNAEPPVEPLSSPAAASDDLVFKSPAEHDVLVAERCLSIIGRLVQLLRSGPCPLSRVLIMGAELVPAGHNVAADEVAAAANWLVDNKLAVWLDHECHTIRLLLPDEPQPYVVKPVETPPPAELSDTATIVAYLTATAPQIIAGIRALLEKEGSEHINTAGVYYALTELKILIQGIKCHLDECIEYDGPIDLDMLDQYGVDYFEAARNLGTRRTLPVLGTYLSRRRGLPRGQGIERVLWQPRAQPSSYVESQSAQR